VIIHAAAVIGSDGFGYRFAQGRFQKIPHTGTVVIEDDVEIGAGTTIDRGMIGATVIGAGTKLDNQVMIAHNCRIGKHNAFASQVGLAGSTTSGDYVRCGGQAGIADHSHLGTGCSIGAKAGLFGTVPDGAEYHGYPAGPAKEQYRIVMTLQKLPEMRKQLRTLEDEVRQLRAQLAQTTAAIREDGDDRPRIPAAA
jgi:UDP-3-O-[3-hydroxymyristoyl] glucosamine N-acyltransferase